MRNVWVFTGFCGKTLMFNICEIQATSIPQTWDKNSTILLDAIETLGLATCFLSSYFIT